jgi:cytochrome P450
LILNIPFSMIGALTQNPIIALRIYPPVAINARMAATSTTLPTGGGPDGTAPIYVAKGQHVIFFTWSPHRSTTVWGPDALEFRPERWEELGDEKIQSVEGGYFPFLLGPRACPGRKLIIFPTSKK